MFERVAAHLGGDLHALAAEAEFGVRRARQLALEPADRIVQREALFMLDQRDHPPDRRGIDRVALQPAQLVERAAVAHHREPRPVGEVGEIAAGDFEQLAERAIAAALAEQRQDKLADDALVEPVAGDADPGRGERDAALRGARRRDAHDREIGRPAAEIGDQDHRRAGQPRRIAVRRAERLIDIVQLDAELFEHQVVALPGECGVGTRAGIFDRAPDDHAVRALVEPPAGVFDQFLEEQSPEILEAERAVEDQRALEQRAGRDALERLDEAAVERGLQIFLDRPWPRLMRDAVPALLVFPEA